MNLLPLAPEATMQPIHHIPNEGSSSKESHLQAWSGYQDSNLVLSDPNAVRLPLHHIPLLTPAGSRRIPSRGSVALLGFEPRVSKTHVLSVLRDPFRHRALRIHGGSRTHKISSHSTKRLFRLTTWTKRSSRGAGWSSPVTSLPAGTNPTGLRQPCAYSILRKIQESNLLRFYPRHFSKVLPGPDGLSS